MSQQQHPRNVLFDGEIPFPMLPAVDHYAGSEKLIRKALQLQQELGSIFDLTCDCEDGARTGAEAEHAQMVAAMVSSEDNVSGRVGARIHDITHHHWQQDIEILVRDAGHDLAFLTLPKVRTATDVRIQIDALRATEASHSTDRPIPVHVLIETHGALRDIWSIAAMDGVESVDFGLMDFVSAHHGALSGNEMKSPGQFTHPVIVRAKCEIVAAALANGVIPSHNVTTELKDIDYIRDDARRARRDFGFLRMWSIHPNQIIPIVEAMRPDFSEVSDAMEIVTAAQNNAWGPIQHKGRLHDRASYRYYWELLCRARATGIALGMEIETRFFSND